MKAYKIVLKLSPIGKKKSCCPRSKEQKKTFTRERNLSFNKHLKEKSFLFD